ncbi:MAG: phage/plasmid primase, P4 family [Ktedonobacteraceae bacterium]
MTATATTIATLWTDQAPHLTALDACERLGWSMIPLDDDKRPCKTGNKHPGGNAKRIGWKHNQELRATPGDIKNWNHRYHPSAFAVVTGEISGLVILDFDGVQGRATMEQLGLNPHVRTGSGGFHVYFKHPGWSVKTLNHKSSKDRPWAKLYPGLDVRGDGGYAAFCGKNTSGPYEWLRDPEPDDLSILPNELRALLGLLVSPEEATQANQRPSADILIDRTLAMTGQEGRNNAGMWLACQLRDNGYSQSEAESIILSYAARAPITNTKGQHEPYTDEEAQASVRSAYSRPAREAWRSNSALQEFRVSRHTASSNGNSNGHNGGGSPPVTVAVDDNLDAQFVLDCLNENEWGDSLLFAHLFRDQAVYDHIEKIWYLYRGHAWKRDDTNKIHGYVSGKLANVYFRTAGALTEQARQSRDQVKIEQAEKHTKALVKRAHELKSVARCKNILIFAAGQDGMGITAKQWDTSKWLLVLPNGVLDLHTGECRKGNPTDYLRTVCPTEWAGLDAPAPRFEKFLQEVFQDRPETERQETILFLQRLLGYGITGETREQVFGVLYGEDGRNGKDSLQRALTHALGEVSGAISKDVFLDVGKQHAAGGATPHLCDLHGKRLAWASEPEKGARFNIGQVKELSGGGEIPVRPLYAKDYYKIQPTHLLLLLTNHKPHADANDNAFWDRLRLITFNMRYVDNPTPGTNERKKDTTLWDALDQEAPGILAWLVRGCLEWQKQGLNTPECILNAGKAYRKEEDSIAEFLHEKCDTSDPNAMTLAGHIYAAYKAWCEGGKMYLLNRTAFGKLLSKRFKKTEPTRTGIYYIGIKLIQPTQPSLFDHEQTVNSSQNSSHPSEDASEANSNHIDKEDREQCEQFLQEVSYIEKTSPYIEGLSEKSIHTIHNQDGQNGVTLHVEPSQSTVNSSQNSSHPSSLPQHECCTVYEAVRRSGPVSHHQFGKKIATIQDDSGYWWCENCVWQHDLMNIACILNYPALTVEVNGKVYQIEEAKQSYLRFAQLEGYEPVKIALAQLERMQEG